MSEQEFNALFAKNLTKCLEINNMTQAELALRMQVSTATASNWCKGIKLPRMDKVDKICSILNIKRSDLMEEKLDRFSIENTIFAANVAKNPIARELFTYYDSTNNIGKRKILDYAADMAKLYPLEQD